MNVFRFRRLSRLSDPRSAREFGDLARRLQGERENAPEEVRPLLEATPDDKLDSLAVRAELRTCGALDYLATVIEERLASNPTSARTLARLVVSIADRLLPPLYPSVTSPPCARRDHRPNREGGHRSNSGFDPR